MSLNVFGKISILFIALLTSSCPSRNCLKEVGESFYFSLNEVDFTVNYKSCNNQSLCFDISVVYKTTDSIRFYIKYTDNFDYLVINDEAFHKDHYGDNYGPIEFEDFLEVDFYLSDAGKSHFNNKCCAFVDYSILPFPVGRYFLSIDI